MQNAEWTETDTALWILNYALNRIWGFSSAGRAPALQAGGQRFDPANLHQKRLTEVPKRFETSLSLLGLEKNTFNSALCIQHSALWKYECTLKTEHWSNYDAIMRATIKGNIL